MTNIRELRKKAHLSQVELAELCGVHQTAISQWEKGRTNPDTDTLIALSQIFHCSIGAILGLDTPDDPVMVPVKGYVQAGQMTFIEDEDICEFVAISPALARRGDYCGLTVKGESMYPVFQPGDMLIVRVQSDVEDNDIVIAMENGENATLKRLKILKNGILLMAENPDYNSIFYTADQAAKSGLSFFGRVVEMRREY